jgi:fimbrial chaperone protein
MGRHYRNTFAALALALVASGAVTGPAGAGTLQVSPINIEVGGGASTAVQNLENKGTTVINAQVRVFKWIHENGKERMVPTKDVVASPPALKIKPGAKATVRIVRLLKTPVVGEETYRLIIDDIPPPPDTAGGTVAFAVRHAIPVFFQAAGIKSDLNWSASMNGQTLVLSARNTGDLHARISQVEVSKGGAPVARINGLAGYALGGDFIAWKLKVKGVGAGSTLAIRAVTNDGNVDTTVAVK